MLPSVVATQVRNCVSDYLRTTFRPTTPGFEGLLDRFLENPDAVCRGPYVSVGLPFRPGSQRDDYFSEIPLGFTPHLHQERSFARLSPPYYQSTLVATGTGSGKTECFLLPILEHCRQQAGDRTSQGIKAILIYPMNALATDQAKRIAKLIHNTPSLRGQVTAGLYVGDREESSSPSMGPDQVITDKQIIRSAPPDLLLTNYKMLDYLLVQPESQTLWRNNQPDTLRYIVVDEFHTFDGAQGTDLACLLRRLKHRLKTPQNHLACVGTSATLGGDSSRRDMLTYAQTIFQEPFDENALIEEDRLSAGEFLQGGLITMVPVPGQESITQLAPDTYSSPNAYLRAQAKLWLQDGAPIENSPANASGLLNEPFQPTLYGLETGQQLTLNTAPPPDIDPDSPLDPQWQIDLGIELKTLPIVHNLIRLLDSGACDYDFLLEKFGQSLRLITHDQTTYTHLLLDSLLSLIAAARRRVEQPDGATLVLPWVTLRVQHWFRELKRMVATVEAAPQLQFSDDLTTDKLEKTLPVLHCRDCGATGWGGVRPSSGANKLVTNNLRRFYQEFFGHRPLVAYVFPCDEDQPQSVLLCPECFTLNKPDETRCQSCHHDSLLRVHVPEITQKETVHNPNPQSKAKKERLVSSHDCPYCKSRLSIIGAQAASLTSAMIGVLYASHFNNDKKLLTFSDSVQDAAHRAGFYSARTYRTTLRTAIAQMVLAHPQGLSLADLTGQFGNFWQSRLGSGANYAATFLPNDLEWLREWDQFISSGKTDLDSDSTLPQLLNNRLTWEITNQFGHRSAIGPSLERSGLCSSHFPTNILAQAVNKLQFALTNEIEALRQVSPERMRQYVLGLLHHLRQRGGILQPATETYIHSGGNTFLLQKPTYMPSLGPTVPTPVFWANAAAKLQMSAQRFERLASSGTRFTWGEDWTQRLFAPDSLVLKEPIIEILHRTLDTLVETGLLAERTCGGGKAWGIPMGQVQIAPEGKVLACDRCGHQLTTSLQEEISLQGMTCLKQSCQGHYQPDSREGLTYYRELYRQGEVHRIIAAEHTGLLNRTNREKLEQRFIHSARRCDPNLISATSTLEMGINIGDLSTVLLCSVPPATANFQQRIGRAGRRDGNALVGVVANGKPHDLYFYADPMRMVDGSVEAAGCYLDASAILQRQLTAFCLDSWVATGITRSDFPKKLSRVLNALEPKKDKPLDSNSFPHNWLGYIHTHQGALLNSFLQLFQDTVTDQTQTELRTFMEKGNQNQGGLGWRILDRLEGVRRERTRLSSQIKNITKKLKQEKEKQKALQDADRLAELEREQSGFRALMQDLNKKNILNFLTDEGLLPNYAFPEAGVTLRSILWRQKQAAQQTNGKKYDTFTLTYERPGKLAIRELVPSGVFYAEGRRVKIDQIDLRLSEPEDWRICRNCNYATQAMQPEGHQKTCPRCGDAMWSDQGQLRRMLRLRQVMATTSDKRSRFGDDSEDRNTAFFDRHQLVDFDPVYREKTFLVSEKDFPFGYEYISRTTFREINLGEAMGVGESVSLAGRKFTTQGFRICKSCGKVMGRAGKNNAPARSKDHMINCQYRDKPEDAKSLDVLYLYREFQSESIRFLMPEEKFWTPQGLNSFVAALQLGLKRKFGGKVDHLHVLVSEEPQPNSSLRKSFLYLYDSVPGGTGYLRQLMRKPEDLQDVFAQSLAVLRACDCDDGCYNCLFAYRNSFEQDQTSRKWAKDLLGEIAKYWPQLEETSEGLSAIRLNSNFESELERNFIEAIRRYKPKTGPLPQLRNDIINGRAGYYLKLGNQAWTIETQVFLDNNNGVSIPSRADFVIRPASYKTNSLPIVIFTDGWEYHKDRLNDDLNQRLAILRSDQYHCWSLTYDDVAKQLDHNHSFYRDEGFTVNLNPQFLHGAMDMYQRYQCSDLQALETSNSFSWLMAYLAHPQPSQWQRWAMLRTLAQADPTSLQSPKQQQTWCQRVSDHLGNDAIQHWELPDKFLCNQIQVSDYLTLWSAADLARHKQTDGTGSFVLIALNDGPSTHVKPSWIETLRLLNLYQFLPHIYAVHLSPQSHAPPMPLPTISTANAQTLIPNPLWTNVKELVIEDSLLPAIDRMERDHWPLPEAGYELANDRGTVVAIAELAWPDYCIAITATPDDTDAFSLARWFTIPAKDLTQDLPEGTTFNTIASKLGGSTE